MKAAKLTLILVIALLSFGTGCGGGENYLEGSITQRFELGFDFTEIALIDGALRVRFQDNVEYMEVGYEATNTVLELILEPLPEGNAPDEEWLDVSSNIELNRYVIIMPEKYLIIQDERRFPLVYQAEIVFSCPGSATGERIVGQFHIVFEEGSTMRGGFAGRIE